MSRALQWKRSLLDLSKQTRCSRTFRFPGMSMGPRLDSVGCYWRRRWGPHKQTSTLVRRQALKSDSSGNRLWHRDLGSGDALGCVSEVHVCGGVEETGLERGRGQTWMRLWQIPQSTLQQAPEPGWLSQAVLESRQGPGLCSLASTSHWL